jgi:tight adherence protein C
VSLASIEYLTLALVAIAVGCAAHLVACAPVPSAPRLGHRGDRRRQTLRKGGSFRLLEPVMRAVAGWVSALPPGKTRERIDGQLARSGDYLGISADEFVALSVLSAAFFAVLGAVFSRLLDLGMLLMVVGALLGATLPWMQVQSEIRRRFRQIDRGLPAAIDILALCMGAGLDFPAALRAAAGEYGQARGAVADEFERILQELEVGHTRVQALRSFERRAPTEAVRGFVGAVAQAEQKGNPLVEVLQIQAQVMRAQRSVAAEEAAARAGVLMIVPLFLLLCCILLLMLGPFIVNGMGI